MTTAYSGDGITFPDNSVQATAPRVGMVNRVINGGMVVDQRNAGAAVTTGTYVYGVDRFWLVNQTDGAFSIQQVTDAPTEFTNSLKVTVTTADASLSSAQRFVINQGLEGFNMADLAYGTANAKTVTLSFWVKSSVTGSYSVGLRAGDVVNGAAYVTSYVVNNANTWEYKTITITGSTIGTWATTNACWAYLIFNLGIGSDFNITANTWVAGANGQGISSDTSLVGTNSATWQITGVQLQKGSTATDFEYVDYGSQLQQCQRYYYRNTNANSSNNTSSFGFGVSVSTTRSDIQMTFPVTMRSSPTFNYGGSPIVTDSISYNLAVSSIASQYTNYQTARIFLNHASSATVRSPATLSAESGINAYIELTAEL